MTRVRDELELGWIHPCAAGGGRDSTFDSITRTLVQERRQRRPRRQIERGKHLEAVASPPRRTRLLLFAQLPSEHVQLELHVLIAGPDVIQRIEDLFRL